MESGGAATASHVAAPTSAGGDGRVGGGTGGRAPAAMAMAARALSLMHTQIRPRTWRHCGSKHWRGCTSTSVGSRSAAIQAVDC